MESVLCKLEICINKKFWEKYKVTLINTCPDTEILCWCNRRNNLDTPVTKGFEITMDYKFKDTDKRKEKVKSLSHVRLFGTLWILAYQAPSSMEFSRQEYWSGLPFPSPADLPDPGIEPRSPALQTHALPSELLWKWEELISPSQILDHQKSCEIMTVYCLNSEKAMATTPVLLSGKSHGRRTLVGCSPWGR